MAGEPEKNDGGFTAKRKAANIRLAILLALVVVAVYAGFILSHL